MKRPAVDDKQATLLAPAARFDDFVREQRGALLGFLRRRLANEDDAQDLAQESLARLIRYREHNPATWGALLYRIAHNALSDRVRQLKTHHAADHVSIDEGVHALASPDQAHDLRLDTEQELARVQRALLRLPARCQEVYLLNRIEGMSYAEIARRCGISVKAVEKHVSKALLQLRKSMLDQPRPGDRR